jgi:hypothetical protein
MRNAELANRANRRRNGRQPLTFQETWYINGGNDSSSTGSGTVRKIVFTYTASDYTGAGPYMITVPHNLNTDEYQWSVIKTENNGPIIVENYHQGETALELEFTGNSKSIKVTITY